jgi:hypothetical protein
MNKKEGKLKTGTHLKTYNFKLYNQQDLDNFVLFQKLVVFHEMTVPEALIKLCKEFVDSRWPKNITLSSEAELREYCRAHGISAGRSNLKKYRDMNLLEKGKDWWTNDDGNIIYALEPTFEFLKKRNEEPFSRLQKGDE